MLTNIGLCENCAKALRDNVLYMWGTYGSEITENLIKAKAKQYPNRYTSSRQKTLRANIGKARGCDCAGLIKNYYFGGWENFRYSSKWDKNVTGFKNACVKVGDIADMPEVKGLAVFMKDHIGVYAGNGKVYECTLGFYGDGVELTDLNGRGWKEYGFLPEMKYEDAPVVEKKKKTPYEWAIRSAPSATEGKIFYYLPVGGIVTVLDEGIVEENGRTWDYVEHEGQKGYIVANFLENANLKKRTTAKLALRSLPSTTDGERYFYIPKGEVVDVLEENVVNADGYYWDKVLYNGTKGYSANAFLTEV